MARMSPNFFHILKLECKNQLGFKSFLWLMERFRPRYLLHGHRHVYNPLEVTETQYEGTTVINVYPYKVLEIPDE